MKKILLSAHCKTQEQKDITKALLAILLSKNYDIDLITNVDLNIQKKHIETVSSDKLLTKDYDVILACNLKGYHCIKHLAKTKNIPVIYMVKQEDCVEEYLYEVALISRFLIINDGDELSRRIFPGDCTTHIPYPYLAPQQNMTETGLSGNILVATEDKALCGQSRTA